jgi:hypothetical protein
MSRDAARYADPVEVPCTDGDGAIAPMEISGIGSPVMRCFPGPLRAHDLTHNASRKPGPFLYDLFI